MVILLPLLIYGGVCLACAHFFARKRQIGFGWSLFFCVMFSPIVGFVVTMLSPKYYDESPAQSVAKQVGGWTLIVLFSLSVLGQLIVLSSTQASAGGLNTLFVTVGLIGAGAYLVARGRGKSYGLAAVQAVD